MVLCVRTTPAARPWTPGCRRTSPFPPQSGTREALHVRLSKRSAALIATGLTGAMLLSACGGGGDDSGSGGGGGAEGGGTFTAYIGEPKSPLVPGNTTESEGAKVIAALWTGLVGYFVDGQVEYTEIGRATCRESV